MNNFPKVTVEIGDFFATDSPALITTSLGACVSVTMFDPVMKIGGMNHIVLPGTFIENDYTYVPVRAICEALGLAVSWDEKEKKVKIQ